MQHLCREYTLARNEKVTGSDRGVRSFVEVETLWEMKLSRENTVECLFESLGAPGT